MGVLILERRRHWRFWGLALAIAFEHWLLYVGTLGALVGSLEYGSPGVGPKVLGVLTRILGAPVMYLLNLPSSMFGATRWWGDDTNLIFGLAAVNALCWGIALARMISWWSRYGEVANHAPARDNSR
jgi:hypothetical protein